MKPRPPFFIIGLFLCLGIQLHAQEMILTDIEGYESAAPGAILDVHSTTKGFIVPRMTTQQRTDLGPTGITESDKNISSMIMCRLYRAGNTDANNDDCFLLAFDLHYEVNTIGSRQVPVK